MNLSSHAFCELPSTTRHHPLINMYLFVFLGTSSQTSAQAGRLGAVAALRAFHHLTVFGAHGDSIPGREMGMAPRKHKG